MPSVRRTQVVVDAGSSSLVSGTAGGMLAASLVLAVEVVVGSTGWPD